MVSKNTIVSHLVELCYQHGIRHVVLSPGSRNAPFSISFNEDKRFTCYTIPDERAAAFFALGLAQYTGQMTAICCTSGTAALNYGPALAEAYYQRIPILAITADRPDEYIDQGIGQSIRQRQVFDSYILKSHHLPTDISLANYAARLINDVLLCGQGAVKGPVHLNVPLYEPLYETIEQRTSYPRVIRKVNFLHRVATDEIERLASKWNKASRKLILIGAIEKDEKLQELISALADDPSVVVLTETHGNLVDARFHESIDRIIEGILPDNEIAYTPDILLTFGQNLISKKIKVLLKRMDIEEHWNIDVQSELVDTFQALSLQIDDTPLGFFRLFVPQCTSKASNYQALWKKLEDATVQAHNQFLTDLAFSDFYCFSKIIPQLPSSSFLQMGNSTVVRYIQLLKQRSDIVYHGNRGTSGIDGCTATAAGAAWMNTEQITCLITGDISFFYDINGLWHPYLSNQLRIILINNRGGGIFRIIPGPATTNQLETSFEARHHTEAEHVAKTYGLNYSKATDKASLDLALQVFFQPSDTAQLLEIYTPTEINDQVLKDYFIQINKALQDGDM